MLDMTIPVLHAASIATSEAFYCGRLGFRRQFAYRPDETRDDPCYMGLLRDRAWLHLSSFEGDGVPGSVVYVAVDDVDGVCAELTARGVAIATGPVDQT